MQGNTIRPRRRRRRSRRQRFMANLYQILVLIIIIMLTAVVVMIGLSIRGEIEHNKFVIEQIEQYDEHLTRVNDQIVKLQSDEKELLDALYYAVKDQCAESSDETLQMLWNSEFENDDAFRMNRDHGIIVIYGILNNHPDIRYDVPVAQALYDLDCARVNLSNKIDYYNTLFDSYAAWVMSYNDSMFCRLMGGEIDDTKHLRMVLQ